MIKKLLGNKKVLLALVGVLLLGGGGVGAFVMMRPKADAPGDDPKEVATADGHATAGESREPQGLVTMDTFLVNLSDPGGQRYMKCSLSLTVTPAQLAEELSSDVLLRARMRDKVLTLLASKTYEEVGSPLGKEGLRREIQAQLAPIVRQGKIEDVLFSDFVVQ